MNRNVSTPFKGAALAVTAVLFGAAALAQGFAPAEPSNGKAAFDRWCAECHAAGIGHPGTQQLERIRGEKLSLLESRKDLEPAYIRYIVRHGQNAMPAYRPSEISDANLELIANYIGRKPVPAKKQR